MTSEAELSNSDLSREPLAAEREDTHPSHLTESHSCLCVADHRLPLEPALKSQLRQRAG